MMKEIPPIKNKKPTDEMMEELRKEAELLELSENGGKDTYEEAVEIIQKYEEGLTPRSIEEFAESHHHGEEHVEVVEE